MALVARYMLRNEESERLVGHPLIPYLNRPPIKDKTI